MPGLIVTKTIYIDVLGINVSNETKIKLPCCKTDVNKGDLLEGIWKTTGCDMSGESGTMRCGCCGGVFKFHLYGRV